VEAQNVLFKTSTIAIHYTFFCELTKNINIVAAGFFQDKTQVILLMNSLIGFIPFAIFNNI
jgi:hypothetical protein